MTTLNSSSQLDASSSVLLHSGNIASWNKLRKKGVVTSTDELVSATEAAFKSWLGRQSEETECDTVVVRNAGLSQKVKGDERQNYIFTLKVFISHWEPDLVQEAVEKTLAEIGVTSVDTLILSFPQCPEEELLSKLKPVWTRVEELARSGLASVVGTADVIMPQLKELYDWATIKPTVNQVNLAHCCTMPEDMVEFSKQYKITLNTHNDEHSILSLTQLHTALSSSLGGSSDHTQWSHRWVTRYSSIIKLRGIIAHKGYVIGLSRTP